MSNTNIDAVVERLEQSYRQEMALRRPGSIASEAQLIGEQVGERWASRIASYPELRHVATSPANEAESLVHHYVALVEPEMLPALSEALVVGFVIGARRVYEAASARLTELARQRWLAGHQG